MYMKARNIYAHQDPEKIRQSYLEYLEDFRKTMCQYAAYKSEIYSCFPTEICGKTYSQIENSCTHSWSRYRHLVWRAYKSADELGRIQGADQLLIDTKLIGVRHFDRLNRVFHYMAFTYETENITEAGIQSAAGSLYGGLDDYDNLQKVVREWVRARLNDTFVVGIAWFTQMYIYLLDMFREKVKHYLLGLDKYNNLTTHTIFLNAVDREYHKVVRPWIQKAVRSVRDTCDSLCEYAHYDITARLKKIVLSIPTSIDHQLFQKPAMQLFVEKVGESKAFEYSPATTADLFKSIPKHGIMEHICGSESYLTQHRDPLTLDHHQNGRDVILELYRAKCGYIIFNIFSQFNSNVVTRIQNYGFTTTSRIDHRNRSLHDDIILMNPIRIGDIANLDLDTVRQNIEQLEQQIGDLTTALTLVENATLTMASSESNRNERQRAQDYRKATELGKACVEDLRRRRGYIRPSTSEGRLNHTQVDSTSIERGLSIRMSDGNESDEDERELMEQSDPKKAKLIMLHLYQRHDANDLALGLESERDLRQDEADPSIFAHHFLDPDTLNFKAAAEKAAANHN
jgi:hypothetical protein